METERQTDGLTGAEAINNVITVLTYIHNST
jgi:hypothetical protein